MSTQQPSEMARLVNLPCEIHMEIFSHLYPMGGAFSFVITCQKLYHNLIVEFYKEAGKQLNWLPLLVGISEGNIEILEKCEKAGAPLNHRWPYLGAFRGSGDPSYFRSCQPLDLALWSGQPQVLQWLTERKAVATKLGSSDFIMMADAQCFVSDLRTAGGGWKPIMYQQGLRFRENYPQNPPPHFIWHGSEIQSTEIFPRLLQLYSRQSVYGPYSIDCIGLASWIAWIWLDLLLSSPNPARILESGFFQRESINGDDKELRLFSRFPPDCFGQNSLIQAVGHLA